MISLVTLLTVLAASDEAPRPTAEEVLTRLEKTEAAIRNLSVTTEYVKLQKDFLPVSEPVRLRLTTAFVVDRDGRTRYECVGEQVNIGPNPGEVRTYRGRWRSAYDGKVAATLSGGIDNALLTAELDRWPAWHGVNPLEFTVHYFRKPVSKFLGRKGIRVVGQEERDSRTVTVVEGEPVTVDGKGWKYRFWVDMERGVVVRRAGLIQYPGQDWREYTRIESRGHEEVKPGIWLPNHVKYESLHTTKADGPEQISWSYEGRNLGWEVNRELPEGTFHLDFPASATVNDHRRPDQK
jgi:hypothetical protein